MKIGILFKTTNQVTTSRSMNRTRNGPILRIDSKFSKKLEGLEADSKDEENEPNLSLLAQTF
jgi:hypothetical protein